MALAVALGASILPAAPVAAAPAPAVAWVDCGNGFQCGTLDVPTDYARPAAGTTRLGLIRLPAADPTQRIGSLFVNPGGPGGSGVDFVRAAARAIYSPRVRARFDIVGFDPRGVGSSEALSCFASAAEQEEFWTGVSSVPVTLAEERRLIARMAGYTRLCDRREGARLPFVSTIDVARDLDRMRAAVGDQALTYVGYSYGSYLGEVYANLFPNRVRALVLDGVLDPETWANQSPRMLHDAAFGGEESLNAFAGACAAAGAACSFASGDTASQVRARLDAILRRIARAPLPAPNADPPGQLTYDLANNAYLVSMYDTFFWPTFADILTLAEAGDGSGLLEFIRLFLPPSDVVDNSLDTFAMVFCTDGTFPRTGAVWPALVRQSEQSAPTFSRNWFYTGLPCATWPAAAAERYDGPWNRRTSAPILLINTVADPATAYAGAVRAQQRLRDARLVTLDGWGHTSTAHPSSCVFEVTDRYLIDRVAPPNGLRCAPDADPFAVARTAGTRRPSLVPGLPPMR
jgi:pimeloyl-ACP methyl ester carboxylesterase